MAGRALRSAGPRQAGFTLFEMLVVLALLALSAWLVLPNVGARSERLALRSAALQVAALARSTRLKAMAEGEDALLIIDLQDRTVARRGAGRPISVPDRTEIAVETARSELSEEQARIRFLPDGRSTGGRITLTAEGRQVAVVIDWLTGSVAVREAGQ